MNVYHGQAALQAPWRAEGRRMRPRKPPVWTSIQDRLNTPQRARLADAQRGVPAVTEESSPRGASAVRTASRAVVLPRQVRRPRRVPKVGATPPPPGPPRSDCVTPCPTTRARCQPSRSSAAVISRPGSSCPRQPAAPSPRRWPRCRIHRMLGFVGQVPGHLSHFRVGIRMRPVVVRALLASRAIQARQSARVGVATPVERQERLIRVPRVAAHDTRRPRWLRASSQSRSSVP